MNSETQPGTQADPQPAPGKPQFKVSIGSGKVAIDGFLRVDIDPANQPDRIMDARKMEFEPGTVDVLYASHILEHFIFEGVNNNSVRWASLVSLLRSWRECLTPNGRLYICVPDMEQLGKILVEFHDDRDIQTMVLDTIYGGARNSFDIHYSGFTKGVMTQLLKQAGFTDVQPFDSFVKDESSHRIAGKLISLNLVAYNGDSQSIVNSAPFVPVQQEEDELARYKRIAEERQQEIATLAKACRERKELIDEQDAAIKELWKFRDKHLECDLPMKTRMKRKIKKWIGR